MNVQFMLGSLPVGSEVVLTWRPIKGDHVCIEGKEYVILTGYEFTYDIDNAKWLILLGPA